MFLTIYTEKFLFEDGETDRYQYKKNTAQMMAKNNEMHS